jgi:hypothetical protein
VKDDCECGVSKTGGVHSAWCPMANVVEFELLPEPVTQPGFHVCSKFTAAPGGRTCDDCGQVWILDVLDDGGTMYVRRNKA